MSCDKQVETELPKPEAYLLEDLRGEQVRARLRFYLEEGIEYPLFRDLLEFAKCYERKTAVDSVATILTKLTDLKMFCQEFYPRESLEEFDEPALWEARDKLNESGKGARTKNSYLTAVRNYYKERYEIEEMPETLYTYLFGGPRAYEMDSPLDDFTVDGRVREITEVTPSKVMEMYEAADNLRDKLIVVLLYELGARTTEVWKIDLTDIEFNHAEEGEIELTTLKNDRGDRPIPVHQSRRVLRDWIENHPCDERDSPLLVNIGGGKGSEKGDRMTRHNINRVLRELGKKVGLGEITVYDLRHSSKEYWDNRLTEGALMDNYGWKSRRTAENYGIDNNRQLKESKRRANDIDIDASDDAFEMRRCPGCDFSIPPTEEFCVNCYTSLEDAETEQEWMQGLRERFKQTFDELGDEKLEEKVQEFAELSADRK